MSEEARRLVELEHLAKMSASVEVQLHSPEWEPIKAILARAREEAADAAVKILDVDPTDAPLIRTLQNKASRYESLVGWFREIVSEGVIADQQLSDAHAEELRELILQTDPETRTALGLPDTGAPTE